METFTILVLFIFLIGLIAAFWIGSKFGSFRKHREWENNVDGIRSDAISKSRAVLSGQFSEQLSPYLPGFNYNPNECRFIGKPVDFIVFRGMDNKKIDEIVFLEVKSGDSKLNCNQKDLKNAIENGRVKFEEYRVPKELTGKKD